MRYLLLIAGIAAIILVFVVNPEGEQQKIQNSGPIIIFGDSLAYGTGATEGNDIASILQDRLGQRVLNAGIPGNTSADARERLAGVVSKEPSIVVVIIGGNDVLRRIPKEQTLENVRTIIHEIEKNGARAVLVGISTLAYNSSYRDIAHEFNIEFVPRLLDKTKGDASLMSDPLHPNDQGYRIFATEIERAIRKLL